MNIIIISGSIRTGRKSHQVAEVLKDRFVKSGYNHTEVLDLAIYDLPVLEEKYGDHAEMPAGLAEIQLKIDLADAMIFVSPEYHGSYSGALKNAVDYFWKEFMRKPIGVVAVASGRFGGINASTAMQQLVLSLGAYPMPYKLLVPTVQNAFDEGGLIKDEMLSKSFDKFVSEFSWLSEAITAKKAQEKA